MLVEVAGVASATLIAPFTETLNEGVEEATPRADVKRLVDDAVVEKRFVVVALVIVLLVEASLVVVALVKTALVEKMFVDVAEVVVESPALRKAKVVEAVQTFIVLPRLIPIVLAVAPV